MPVTSLMGEKALVHTDVSQFSGHIFWQLHGKASIVISSEQLAQIRHIEEWLEREAQGQYFVQKGRNAEMDVFYHYAVVSFMDLNDAMIFRLRYEPAPY